MSFDSAGNQRWARVKNSGGNDSAAGTIAVDAAGNVYVAGTYRGYVLISYDSNGNERWARNSDIDVVAIGTDGAGNVYAAGSFRNGSNIDFGIASYDTNGNVRWTRRKNGPSNHDDLATAAAIDSSGNSYVTGRTFSASNYTCMTVSYDSAGNERWTALKGAPDNQSAGPQAIAVDSAGRVYVTGGSSNGASWDFLTFSYDATGSERWATLTGGEPNSVEVAQSVALDDAGNVFVTGISDSHFFTVSYSNSGVERWRQTKSDSLGGASALTVDGTANVYVTGAWGTVSYGPAGAERWTVVNGDATHTRRTFSIAADLAGNVCVAGWSNDGTLTSVLAASYTGAGAQRWLKTSGPRPTPTFIGGKRAVAAGASSNVYVTGSYFNGANRDFFHCVV